MGDAVDRKAEELREQRRLADEALASAKASRDAALSEFRDTLLALYAANTRHPIEVIPAGRDRSRVVCFSAGPGPVRERVIVEVEAVSHHAPDLGTLLYLTNEVGEVAHQAHLLTGAPPSGMAARVVELAIPAMARVLARGGRIVSREEAERLDAESKAAKEQEENAEQRAADQRYAQEHRWDWVGQIIGWGIAFALMRFVVYPWLRPLIDSWFN